MMDVVDETFAELRPLLLGLAYRMLGSMWDAEDVVQEAYLRWCAADRAEVRSARAFLTTVVSRLALDELRSARVTREAYPGPWLPEPVAAGELGPLDTAELRDTVSYATLHLMEKLNPPERAVVVLRDAFELPYEQIAEILGVSAGHCRQLHRRALAYLGGTATVDDADPARHRELVERFLDAARNGDLSALTQLLTADVVAWNDGGGKVRAALHPIEGRDKVLAFVGGLLTRYGMGDASLVEVNGATAIRLSVDGADQVVAISVRDGRIHDLYAVMNPDKLRVLSDPTRSEQAPPAPVRSAPDQGSGSNHEARFDPEP